jgi:hypothetical protein
MMYAPRALRHFSLAAAEGRAPRIEASPRPEQVKVRSSQVRPAPRRTVVRLWVPATLVFLLLAPFAFLLAPLICLAPRPYRVSPFAAVFGLGQLLLSLGGTLVDIDARDALVRIRIL